MAEYVCTICNFVYDEAIGDPDSGITPGTLWEDVPEDWVCPDCGATKSAFEKEGGLASEVEDKKVPVIETSEDMKELSPLEISALCSNLALGCEKQYRHEEAALFGELATYFKQGSAPTKDPKFSDLLQLIESDLNENIPKANAIASEKNDRGALRALVWGDKVSKILKSILGRYERQGDSMLENTGVYVCTICGFIYIGDMLPDLCPVCKVANWKFEKVEGS